eukprot:CAMPEP_0168383310 /NCGR_PEP_ID=MMETSP0228-20121227/13837_1 /TAXON_ID=133427 /ORGANISM="Protoceratium reticulatum, Strain CCCM 535 (=CCMP 1889)" /LENGTH=307 /DNA_ID=CAMNT_0008396457 /DNA_START=554 /DNA_END=1478 /DNA_ORIENTATION=-
MAKAMPRRQQYGCVARGIVLQHVPPEALAEEAQARNGEARVDQEGGAEGGGNSTRVRPEVAAKLLEEPRRVVVRLEGSGAEGQRREEAHVQAHRVRPQVLAGLAEAAQEVLHDIQEDQCDDREPQQRCEPQCREVPGVRERQRDGDGARPDEQRAGCIHPADKPLQCLLEEVCNQDVVSSTGEEAVDHDAHVHDAPGALPEGRGPRAPVGLAAELLAEERDHHEGARLDRAHEEHRAQARQQRAPKQGHGQAEDAGADEVLREVPDAAVTVEVLLASSLALMAPGLGQPENTGTRFEGRVVRRRSGA